MSNDEIKTALRTKAHITYGGVRYDHAQAWRVTYSEGKYISSLELHDGRHSIVVAPAEKCEVANG